jgi:tRNA pseudouridine32 synthase / 23S rRNA pseudouridine746 synthase
MPVELLYRSPSLLAVNKRSGISLFADRTGAACLWDVLNAEVGAATGVRLYPAHRLDKGTSGVLLVALNPSMQADINRAFAARRVRKFYVARVVGDPALGGASGMVDLPLAQGRKSRYRVAGPRVSIRRRGNVWRLVDAADTGLPSQTRLRRLSARNGHTLLLLQPLTGRTHQLRVHLSWIGHPLCGDHLYGKPGNAAQEWSRLALHCHRLVVTLPGRTLSFRAPLPSGL